MNTPRLIQLSSQLDQVLEFRVLPDGREVDENGNPIARAAGTALVGGGVVAGGYYGNRAVQAAGGYGRVATSVAGGLGERASAMGAPGVGNTIAGAPRRAANYAGSISEAAGKGYGRSTGGALEKLLRALKSGGKAALHTRFHSREDRLVNLSAKLDQVLEFRTKKGDGWVAADRLFAPNYVRPSSYDDLEKSDEFGYHPDQVRRSAKIGAAGVIGGIATDRVIRKAGGYKAVGNKAVSAGASLADRLKKLARRAK